MEKKVKRIIQWCVDNSGDKRYFFRFFFNIRYDQTIEFGAGIEYGYSRDYVDWGRNYFGDTPMMAIERCLKDLDSLKKRKIK